MRIYWLSLALLVGCTTSNGQGGDANLANTAGGDAMAVSGSDSGADQPKGGMGYSIVASPARVSKGDDIHVDWTSPAGLDLTGIDMQNNISWGNGGANLAANGATASNNLTNQDPMFVDPAKGDFHLRPGSPALETAVALPEVQDDREGHKRPLPAGGKYDMGAYERP